MALYILLLKNLAKIHESAIRQSLCLCLSLCLSLCLLFLSPSSLLPSLLPHSKSSPGWDGSLLACIGLLRPHTHAEWPRAFYVFLRNNFFSNPVPFAIVRAGGASWDIATVRASGFPGPTPPLSSLSKFSVGSGIEWLAFFFSHTISFLIWL